MSPFHHVYKHYIWMQWRKIFRHKMMRQREKHSVPFSFHILTFAQTVAFLCVICWPVADTLHLCFSSNYSTRQALCLNGFWGEHRCTIFIYLDLSYTLYILVCHIFLGGGVASKGMLLLDPFNYKRIIHSPIKHPTTKSS